MAIYFKNTIKTHKRDVLLQKTPIRRRFASGQTVQVIDFIKNIFHSPEITLAFMGFHWLSLAFMGFYGLLWAFAAFMGFYWP